MEILRSKDICFGRPRINGTRLEVYNIISDLYHETNIDGYLKEHDFSRDDIKEIINYCKTLSCQSINHEYEKYCSGCILSTMHENFDYKEVNFKEIDYQTFIDNNNDKLIGFGDKRELEEEMFGKPGWVIADKLEII